MTDTVSIREWIEERRGIHAAATQGELTISRGGTVMAGGDAVLWPLARYKSDPVEVSNIESFVDAHNMFPRALNALQRVLELHCSATTYQNVCECENEGEDHEDERHVEAEDGTPICIDLPDYAACLSCQVDGEPVEWPCATVQAIEGAINDE